MNPIWHALRLALEMGAWFVLIGSTVAALLFAMQDWLHVRIFR